ncbi:hypothetical protein R6Q59_009877 [Mikania micrantha]
MSTYTVRPSNSEKEAFRVKLTAVSLLSLRLKPGDVVILRVPDGDDKPRPAIAWENSGSGMKDTIVQTSKFLQELYGFKLGDKIAISRSTESLKDASVVTVRSNSGSITCDEQVVWQANLSAIVPTKHDVLAPGQKLVVEVGKKKAEFEVLDVGGLLAQITDSTQFKIGQSQDSVKASEFRLDFAGVGGLQPEIDRIRKQMKAIMNREVLNQWSGFQAKHGLLLYGPKGVGKTLIQESMMKSSWASVTDWSPGTKSIPATFPRLVVIGLHDLTQKNITELLALFKEIRGTQTLMVAETRHPNEVSERLRTRNAFAVELELPIPDLDRRRDILQVLRAESDQPSDQQLQEIAARTHGFVGMDLDSLLQSIWESASERDESLQQNATLTLQGKEGETYGSSSNEPVDVESPDGQQEKSEIAAARITVSQSDINYALTQVRPSALQQVFLEKPNVRWSDIGGQHTLKQQLTNAVERTLSPTLRARMARVGVEVTKGVLLYGPPGCSKTLLAKALATEAELNFLAVKGAELISMYVGESERATREVFRKARAAAPSILFFDEIDAIASRPSRGKGGGGDLNVLTTLLNEMDGFEELRNVIVIAATNKPQDIDPALLRPGRFDNVVFVGLPDAGTRREILEKRFQGLSVSDGVRHNMMEWTSLTSGHSGAEVVAICKAAGEKAIDNDRDEITEEDVRAAITTAPKGVTSEILHEYHAWNKSRSVLN